MQSENNPLLSIIVPVYNTAPYLEECLDSLRNQTLKNIEIVCVNDGSTDNSLEILKKYELEDDRIVLISQTNKGVSVARNEGIKVARGKYLFFFDSDDYAYPELAENSVVFAEKNDCEVVNINIEKDGLTNLRIPYVRNLSKKLRFLENRVYTNVEDGLREMFLLCVSSPSNFIIRREFWTDNFLKFPENVRINEDIAVNGMICSVVEKMGFLFPERRPYRHRVRKDESASSLSYKKSDTGRCKGWDILLVFKMLQQYFHQTNQTSSPVCRAWYIRYLCSLETLYYRVPRDERKYFKGEIESLWDDQLDKIVQNSEFLPFRTRCFWFWIKGRKLPLQLFGWLFTQCLFKELRWGRSLLRRLKKNSEWLDNNKASKKFW